MRSARLAIVAVGCLALLAVAQPPSESPTSSPTSTSTSSSTATSTSTSTSTSSSTATSTSTSTSSSTPTATPSPAALNTGPRLDLSVARAEGTIFAPARDASNNPDESLLFRTVTSRFREQETVLTVVDSEGDDVQSPVYVMVTPSALSCSTGPLAFRAADLAGLSLYMDTQSEAYKKLPGDTSRYFGVWEPSACRLVLSWATTAGAFIRLSVTDVRTLLATVKARLFEPRNAAIGSFNIDFSVQVIMTDVIRATRTVQGSDTNKTWTSGPWPTLFKYRLLRPVATVFITSASGAYPAVHPTMSVVEGAARVPVLPALTITPNASVVRLARVSLAQGCGADDALYVPSGALTTLLGVSPPANSDVPPTDVDIKGCPAVITLAGVSVSGPAMAAFLSQVQFRAGPANQRPAASGVQHAGYRVITFGVSTGDEIEAEVSATVAVDPVNDLLRWPDPRGTPQVWVHENAPPVLEVTVAQNCSDVRVVASMAPSGALCIEDPDPAVGWSSAPSAGSLPLPLVQLGSYTVTASASVITPPDASVYLAPTVIRSGGLNCSAAVRSGSAGADVAGLSAPALDGYADGLTPCWRVWLTLASTPFDAESPTTVKSYSLQLSFTDTFAFTEKATSGSVVIRVENVDDAAQLEWAGPTPDEDTARAALAGRYGPLPTGDVQAREVWLDEADGGALPEFRGVLRVVDGDVLDVNKHALVLRAVSPEDYSPALGRRSIASWLVGNQTGGVGSTGVGVFTLAPAPGARLVDLPAKLLTLSLCVISTRLNQTACTDAPNSTLTVTVRVVRRNAPVTLTPSARTRAVAENSPIGSVVDVVTPFDADATQSLTLTIVSTNSTSPTPLFEVRPLLNSVTFVDPSANHSVVNKVLSRSFQIVVASDALDYEDAETATTTLQLLVQDDGSFNSSALGAGLRTNATLSLTVHLLDLADPPVVAALEHVPEGGLSTHGGDVVDIVGTGLGLPSGRASNVSARLASTDGGGLAWDLLSCAVVERLSRIRCTSAPGYGDRLALTVRVGDQVSPPSSFTVAYQPPFVSSVAFDAGTLQSTDGVGRINITGAGFSSVGAARGLLTATLIGPPGSGLGPGGAVNLTCNVVSVEAAVTGVFRESTRLSCPMPPGAGTNLQVAVALAGRSSRATTISYAAATITSVTAVGGVLSITGQDLGAGVEVLDWVRYAVEPDSLTDPNRCARIDYASCEELQARNCSYTTPHVEVTCRLDPRGFGVGFRVRLQVLGQVSHWSAESVEYDPPVIDEVIPLDSAAAVEGDPSTAGRSISTAGGAVLNISGTGFATGAATRVTIGGVPVQHINTVAGVGADTPGSLIIRSAPPGFGTVTVNVTVGRRVALGSLTYEATTLSTLSWQEGLMSDTTVRIKVVGRGLAACVICARAINVTSCDPVWTLGTYMSSCAKPDAYRQDLYGLDAVPPVSYVSIDGGLNTNFSAVSLSGDLVSLRTSAKAGIIALRLGGEDQPTSNISYDFQELSQTKPFIRSALWPRDAEAIRLVADNAGQTGAVLVTPVVAYRGMLVNSTAIECPVVWTTQLQIRADNDAKIENGLLPAAKVLGGTYTDAVTGVRLDAMQDFAVVSALVSNFSSSLVWEDPVWVRYTVLPCRVTLWDGRQFGSNHEVTFTPPPLQGTVSIAISVSGRTSAGLDLTYPPPVITSVSPTNGPTTGSDVTIYGTGLGFATTFTELWANDALGAAWNVRRAGLTKPPPMRNVVVFKYQGSLLERLCDVRSWTPTAVTCRTPEGVGGSANEVFIRHADNSTAPTASNTNQVFTYDLPRLFRLTPDHGPTAGGYNVTLQGLNFARLVSARAVLPVTTTPSPSPSPAAPSPLASNVASNATSNASQPAAATPLPDTTGNSTLPDTPGNSTLPGNSTELSSSDGNGTSTRRRLSGRGATRWATHTDRAPSRVLTAGSVAGPRRLPQSDLRASRQGFSMSSVHACAIDGSGDMWCWGRSAQLGTGAAQSLQPARVISPVGLKWKAVDASATVTCAIATVVSQDGPGDLYCWGTGAVYLDGRNPNTLSATALVPTKLVSPGFPQGRWVSISVSKSVAAACALTEAGQAWCWGAATMSANHSAAVLFATRGLTAQFTQPGPVDGNIRFASVRVLADSACGVSTTGVGYCWGSRARMLGDGAAFGFETPVPSMRPSGGPVRLDDEGRLWAAIAGTSAVSCGVSMDGQVHCWGVACNGTFYGRDPAEMGVVRPVPIPGLRAVKVSAVAVGTCHACALTQAGTLLCWGTNTVGQVGVGFASDDEPTPQLLPFPSGVSGWASISAVQTSTCAVSTAGALYCWGQQDVRMALLPPDFAVSQRVALVDSLAPKFVAGVGSLAAAASPSPFAGSPSPSSSPRPYTAGCPPGFVRAEGGDFCYGLSTGTVRGSQVRTNAALGCPSSALDARPANARSWADTRAMQAVLASERVSSAWIGLAYNASGTASTPFSRLWVWDNTTEAWRGGEWQYALSRLWRGSLARPPPSDSRCGFMTSAGVLADGSCSSNTQRVLCEVAVTERAASYSPTPTPSVTGSPKPWGLCAPGWTRPPGSGHCFRVTTGVPAAGTSQHAACSSLRSGAQPAALRTSSEWEALQALARARGAPAVFVGLSDQRVEAGGAASSFGWVWLSSDTTLNVSMARRLLAVRPRPVHAKTLRSSRHSPRSLSAGDTVAVADWTFENTTSGGVRLADPSASVNVTFQSVQSSLGWNWVPPDQLVTAGWTSCLLGDTTCGIDFCVSTAGYGNLTVSFFASREDAGPNSVALDFLSNSGTAELYNATLPVTGPLSVGPVALPPAASDSGALVCLRIRATGADAASGLLNLTRVIIHGTALTSPAVSPTPPANSTVSASVSAVVLPSASGSPSASGTPSPTGSSSSSPGPPSPSRTPSSTASATPSQSSTPSAARTAAYEFYDAAAGALWGPGQPDNVGDADCVVLRQFAGEWLLDDVPCSSTAPVACEYRGEEFRAPSHAATPSASNTPSFTPSPSATAFQPCPLNWYRASSASAWCFAVYVPVGAEVCGNYTSARQQCMSLNPAARMAAVRSASDVSSLNDVLYNSPYVNVRMGMVWPGTGTAWGNNYTYDDEGMTWREDHSLVPGNSLRGVRPTPSVGAEAVFSSKFFDVLRGFYSGVQLQSGDLGSPVCPACMLRATPFSPLPTPTRTASSTPSPSFSASPAPAAFDTCPPGWGNSTPDGGWCFALTQSLITVDAYVSACAALHPRGRPALVHSAADVQLMQTAGQNLPGYPVGASQAYAWYGMTRTAYSGIYADYTAILPRTDSVAEAYYTATSFSLWIQFGGQLWTKVRLNVNSFSIIQDDAGGANTLLGLCQLRASPASPTPTPTPTQTPTPSVTPSRTPSASPSTGAPASPAAQPCADGWTRAPESGLCMRATDGTAAYVADEARAACRALEPFSIPASIRSWADAAFMSAVLKGGWVGLVDVGGRAGTDPASPSWTWEYDDGSGAAADFLALASAYLWAPSQPDDFLGEDCVEVLSEDAVSVVGSLPAGQGVLADSWCEEAKRVLCEYDPTRVVPSATPTPSSTPSPFPSFNPNSTGSVGTSVDDATSGDFEWRLVITVKSALNEVKKELGLVAGAGSGTVSAAGLLAVNHSAVQFIMPPVEGNVSVSLSFSLNGKEAFKESDLTPVPFYADRPVVTAIVAGRRDVNDTFERTPQDDPCFALNTTVNTSALVGTLLCTAQARSNWDWGSYPLDTTGTRSCLSTSAGTRLRVEGFNFGSGNAGGESIKLSVAGTIVECQKLGGASLLDKKDDTLVCELKSELPRGPADVNISIAYHTVAVRSSSGIVPRAMCDCGKYADRDGDFCTACPDNGRCGGADEPSRSVPGYRKVVPLEWVRFGLYSSVEEVSALVGKRDTGIDPFVRCPSFDLCLANNECDNTTDPASFMCAACAKGFVRGVDTRCNECEPGKVASVRAGISVVIGAMLITAWGLQYWRVQMEAEAIRLRHAGCDAAPDAHLFLERVQHTSAARMHTCGGCHCLNVLTNRPWCRRVMGFTKRWRDNWRRGVLDAAARRVRIRGEQENEAQLRAEREANAAEGDRRPSLLVLVKVLMTCAQTIAAISNYATPDKLSEWSKDSSADMQVIPELLVQFRWVGDLGMSFASFQCAMGSMPYGVKLQLYMAAPFMVIFPGALIVYGLYIAYVKLPFFWRAVNPLGEPPTTETINERSAYAVVFAFFLMLPAAVNAVARAQNCQDVTLGGYLKDLPELSCSDPDFRSLRRIARVVGYLLLVFPLSVGLALSWAGRREWKRQKAWQQNPRVETRSSSKKTLDELLLTVYFRFLAEGYRVSELGLPRAWETLVLMRKSLLMGLSTGFIGLTVPGSQLVATMMVLSLSFALHVRMTPYASSSVNILEGMSLLAQLAFTFAIMPRTGGGGGAGTIVPGSERLIFDLLAVVVATPFLLMWAFILLDEAFYNGTQRDKLLRAVERLLERFTSAEASEEKRRQAQRRNGLGAASAGSARRMPTTSGYESNLGGGSFRGQSSTRNVGALPGGMTRSVLGRNASVMASGDVDDEFARGGEFVNPMAAKGLDKYRAKAGTTIGNAGRAASSESKGGQRGKSASSVRAVKEAVDLTNVMTVQSPLFARALASDGRVLKAVEGLEDDEAHPALHVKVSAGASVASTTTVATGALTGAYNDTPSASGGYSSPFSAKKGSFGGGGTPGASTSLRGGDDSDDDSRSTFVSAPSKSSKRDAKVVFLPSKSSTPADSVVADKGGSPVRGSARAPPEPPTAGKAGAPVSAAAVASGSGFANPLSRFSRAVGGFRGARVEESARGDEAAAVTVDYLSTGGGGHHYREDDDLQEVDGQGASLRALVHTTSDADCLDMHTDGVDTWFAQPDGSSTWDVPAVGVLYRDSHGHVVAMDPATYAALHEAHGVRLRGGEEADGGAAVHDPAQQEAEGAEREAEDAAAAALQSRMEWARGQAHAWTMHTDEKDVFFVSSHLDESGVHASEWAPEEGSVYVDALTGTHWVWPDHPHEVQYHGVDGGVVTRPFHGHERGGDTALDEQPPAVDDGTTPYEEA